MEEVEKDLIYTILILIGLALVWYFTGGPSRPSASSGPFLKRPVQQHQQEILNRTKQEADNAPSSRKHPGKDSAFRYQANLAVGSGAKESSPQKEYVEIKASSVNERFLLLTGWSLKNKEGQEVKIGKGSYLPFPAKVNSQQIIFLKPGERAYVVTGESPIGTSFRVNKCTGYFEEFQNFYPPLAKSCPLASEDNPPGDLDGDCLNFINGIPRCETASGNIPSGLSGACRQYVTQKINYQTCVQNHKNDSDFYGKEWRVYLGKNKKLWNNGGGTIILSDENGKTIDWQTY